MPFGSRRMLSSAGPTRTATVITTTGTDFCISSSISNDVDGNTQLGNGSYSSVNDLRTSTGTGGFSNVPMVIELTPGRVYSLALVKEGSGTSAYPSIRQRNDGVLSASINFHYARMVRLNNPPFIVQDQRAGGSVGNIASFEPVDGVFTFENEAWVNNRLILANGFAVPTTDDDLPVGTIGTVHTSIGLFATFNNSGLKNARVKFEVKEGYFF